MEDNHFALCIYASQQESYSRFSSICGILLLTSHQANKNSFHVIMSLEVWHKM